MTHYIGRKLLIIEDDQEYAQAIVDRLGWQGYRIKVVSTGRAGLAAAREGHAEIIILDIRLATDDEGWQMLRQLQADAVTQAIPVIVHSVTAEFAARRTNGYNLGAWYCLDKNDSLAELEAVVRRAIDTRYRNNDADKQPHLEPLDFDAQSGAIWIDRQAQHIKLSREQSKLLALLVERAGQICSRDMIAQQVYKSHDVSNQQIDRLISRLRQKLNDPPKHARFIESVRGVGYKLRVEKRKE